MKLRTISRFKHFFYSGFLCAGVNYSVDTVPITQYNLDQYLHQVTEQYLSSQGVSAFNIPKQLQSEYNLKLQQARQSALDQLKYHGHAYLDNSDLQIIIRQKMGSFVDNLRTIVYNYQLEQAITNAINAFLGQHNLSQDSIGDRDVAEFINRSGRVKTGLQNIMYKDNRDYVRINEIEKLVRDELAAFVARIKQNYSFSVQPSAPPLDDFFVNPSPRPSSTTSSTTAQGKKVMLYDLEQEVMNAAHKTLKTYSIDPNKIPARVVAPFSDAVQRMLRTIRGIAHQQSRNYVWNDELEVTVIQEMQPVIDKIVFKGESCPICLESYVKGQRVGLTSCGHHYHKDCIYTWFSYQKTCPQCNAANIIVEKIETAG